MTPYKHAVSSATRFGGKPADYFPVHEWFDASKAHWPHFTHRALRHHTLGILEAEKTFGISILNSDRNQIATRLIAEQHLMEDHGRLPTLADWLRCLRPKGRWMSSPAHSETPLEDQQRQSWLEAVMFGKTEQGLEEFSRSQND